MDVIRAETLRILLSEKLVPMRDCVGDLFVAAQEDVPGVHVEYHPQGRHLLRVHLRPLVLVREQGDAVRMVHQAHHALGRKVREDRDDDGFICIDGQVGEAPTGAVPGVEGDLVAFLEAGFFEDDVETRDRRSHLRIGQAFAADGIQGGLVPVLPGRVLKPLQVVRILRHFSIKF